MSNDHLRKEPQTEAIKSSGSTRSTFLGAEEIALLPVLLYNAPPFVVNSEDPALKNAYRKAAPELYKRRDLITRLDQIIDHFQTYGIEPSAARNIIDSALNKVAGVMISQGDLP